MNDNDLSNRLKEQYEKVSGMISEIMDEIMFDYELSEDRLTLYIKNEKNNWEYFVVDKYLSEQKMKKTIFAKDCETFINSITKNIEPNEKNKIEFRMKYTPDDRGYKWYRFIYSLVKDNDNDNHIVGRIICIDEEKKREFEIVNKNKLDPLTGHLNLKAFHMNFDEYTRSDGEKGEHALLCVDVDNMGVINRVFGHVFADTIIRDIAHTIRTVFRTSDIIGRTGGDEFCVFIKNISREIAVSKAKELCRRIKRTYKTDTREIDVTCSIAVVFYPTDGKYFDVLMKNIDSAMSEAKKTKNTFVCFNNNMSQKKRAHIIKRNLRLHSIEDYDIEFIAYAFSLMTNSMDIDTSVNMLLSQAGKHFGLSEICIFERIPENRGYRLALTNKWEKNKGTAEINFKDLKKYDDRDISGITYDENEMACVNNIKTTGLTELYNKINALVICKFSDNIINQGRVVFFNEEKRNWTPFELGTFYEISRLLSVFITMRRKNMEDARQIRKYARFDMLTGLMKMEVFKEKAQKRINEKSEDKVAAIVYYDINNFSYVNERFGYEAGDKILIEFADSLLLYGDKRISSHPYSDYFISYIEDESRENIEESIILQKEKWFKKQNAIYPVANMRLSAGVYFIEEKGEDITAAIENANLARKYFKNNKNIRCEVYTEELKEYKLYEQEIAANLNKDMKDGYLELFLQPKFSLDSRKVIGAEALARWRNRDTGYKFPNDFIPVLEKFGYIVDLDFYMYEQVLTYMKKWKDMGKKLIPISINFSRVHNYYENFVDRVIELADKYGIDKTLIEIETTETAMFNNEGVMLTNMEKLREQGFRIDIDDFGTGFSSLNLILKAPFDIVKVDKSMLSKNITSKDRKYIKRLIDLIYDVEKEIIFEGVETEEQAEMLLSCGCVKAQGWLFDKAIRIDEFEKKYIL